MRYFDMVYGEEWEGIYENGHLVWDGHDAWNTFLQPLIMKVPIQLMSYRGVNQDWLDDEGTLPRLYSSIVFSE